MSNDPQAQITDRLLDEIEGQKAVLLLGHGFLRDAHRRLPEVLKTELGDGLLHFHERDGLFLFQKPDAKTDAQNAMAALFRAASVDFSTLRKIAELPFSLIVSANPDKHLEAAFARFRCAAQFDYFTSGSKDHEYSVEKPTRENPLLYNLCGSVEDPDSLILDYDDLYSMLKNLLSDIGVPNDLRTVLRKSTTYIFIGFHFERWYTQLFLRYLNMNASHFDNNSKNFALQTSFENADAQAFFIHQFNVKFIGADLAFLDALHERFSKTRPEKMRKLVETTSETAATAIVLIEKSDFEAAFSMLKNLVADSQKDLLSITEAMHSQLLKDIQNRVISEENRQLQLGKIRLNLLEIAKNL